VEDFSPLRQRLLELHKRLVDTERETYERQHGRVTAHQFLQALTSDPALSWLAPLNTAIVRFDELLDVRVAAGASDEDRAAFADQLALLRELLSLDTGAEQEFASFGRRYARHVHNSPDVAFAHGAVWNLLRAS